MPLTCDWKETFRLRARRDPEYRAVLLVGGVECLLAGELELAKRDFLSCIAGVGGFEALGEMTGKSPERLAEMFSREGELPADDLFEILVCLQRHEGLVIKVSSEHGEVGLIDYTADPEDDLTDDHEDRCEDDFAGAEAVAAI